MGLTFWETLYSKRLQENRQRAADFARSRGFGPEKLLNHGITGTCTMALAENGAPPGAGAAIAAEMAALRALGRESIRNHADMPRVVAFMGIFLCGTMLYDLLRTVIPDIQEGRPWLGKALYQLALGAILGLAMLGARGYMLGHVRLMNRRAASFAEQLEGKSGSDTLDEVIAWLEARWAWFLPPDLATRDVLWAIGSRRGAPVLVVLELFTGSLISRMAGGLAAGVRRTRIPGGEWHRTNVFIHGATIRDSAHRENLRKTLAPMHSGVIQGPNGVYLYGPFAFYPFISDRGYISDIWIDLIDQVIDPDFHGSERAAKLLHDELVLSGRAAPADRPHA